MQKITFQAVDWRALPIAAKVRFYTKFSPGGTEECWFWGGITDKDGYGVFPYRSNGRRFTLRAHRLMKSIDYGVVPSNRVVMHECDVPGCVNPKHLRVATHAENEADKDRKGRRPTGEDCGTSRLSELEVRIAIAAMLTGIRGVDLARSAGVKKNAMYHIAAGETWACIYEELNHAERARLKANMTVYGSRAPWSKLSEQDVRDIRARLRAGELQKDVALDYHVHAMTISKIANRTRWKHIL